jgi:hypothetical protein
MTKEFVASVQKAKFRELISVPDLSRLVAEPRRNAFWWDRGNYGESVEDNWKG